jgi:AbrB family looped-hinge helix DNA binding protein
MADMDAIAEIDKAGRLVVPKKLRDALHLVPGTRLTLKQESDRLVIQLEARPRGLYLKKGTLVYDVGLAPPADVVDWVSQDREARGHALAGQYLKP